ncbi:sulfatase-like hydrolase/transferase [Mesorhizobium sp. Z1-4]|uniref:sulfatase family protein n=1 Tax=Mesorhizobium sp. Z1-4 TaxID=2448478 RepID=UPI000FD8730A|nr:sulfatase-like hydrolase/transferase [Mesorhizobium sp. Z1-4]
MNRPNILWICTDQQRWDTLSYLGHPGARTPNLDKLARQGVLFDRAYCQSPICTPSRASFLSGKYPIAHGVHKNGNAGFPNHTTLVPKLFRDAGYRTGLIGKLHLSRAEGVVEERPIDDGYDEFYWSHHPDPDWPEKHDYHDWLKDKGIDAAAIYDPSRAYGAGVDSNLHQTRWAGDRAKSFIRRHKGKPWFLSMNLFDPHPPFDPPLEYLKKFDRNKMPGPIFAESDIAHQQRFVDVDQQARVAIDPRRGDPDNQLYEGTPERDASATHDTPPDIYDAKQIQACYHAMIAFIDDMVGELMDELDLTGQRGDTIVLFMSDHGELLGDHGLIYKGCRFYEGLTRVPMMFSWPEKIRDGVISRALVELVDIPQTLLEAAGLPEPLGMQGRSLYPLLSGVLPADRHKSHVLCEYFDALGLPEGRKSRATMYFDGRYKLCIYHGVDLGELYDLQQDPQELNDLWESPDFAELRCRLIAKHFDAMMLASEPGPVRVASY